MRLRALFFLAILFFCLPARSNSNDDDRVKIDLHLYFWPAGIDGNVTAGTHTTDTSMKLADILRNLRMEANGAFKISKENWFLFNDFIYLDVVPNVRENIPPGIPININLDATTLTDMLVVGRQWQSPISWNLFVGVRYIYDRIELDTAVGNIVSTKKWLTPTVGAGVKLPFNDRLFFNFIANIGAANRSFNWEILPTFCWKFNTIFSAEAGYRLLDIRYKENDFRMNTIIHGPIIGLTISF